MQAYELDAIGERMKALSARSMVKKNLILAIFFAVAVHFAMAGPALASDWYVSTSGNSSANGSQAQPWDLCTAVGCSGAAPASVQPGDTIWLSGGTYTAPPSGFIFRLNGTASTLIWVRNIKTPPPGYTGLLNPDGSERVILNGNGQNFPDIAGSYTAVEGLEFVDLTLQTGNRYLQNLCSGCPPSLYPPGASGPEVNGPGNRMIHCVVHDNSAGLYSYSAAPNAEIYGNISYYNGYIYGGEGLGHGYYMQNNVGNKWITNNFAGDNVDNGFQIYGSGGATIGFVTSGNASYDNGSLATWQYNLVVGSAAGTSGNTFDSFYSFFPLTVGNGYVAIGEYDASSDVAVTNSVFVGGNTTLIAEGIGGPATFTGNSLVNSAQNAAGAPSLMLVFAQFANQSKSEIVWDNNQYYGPLDLFYTGNYDGLSVSNGSRQPFSGWQTASGFDAHSTYSSALPTGAWTYVLPDKYTNKRANIIIYNWSAYADSSGDLLSPCTGACASVAVDLSGVLSVGDQFIIQDTQNWFGPHVLTGTYQGGTVSIPMAGLGPKPVPWGFSVAPAHTAPAFGTFVVFATNGTDAFQPDQTIASGNGGNTSSTPTTATTTTASSASNVVPLFAIGESVAVAAGISPANVRSGNITSSPVVGTEVTGSIGTVVAGPTPVPSGGTPTDILWEVQFSNLTGWVWQSLLVPSSTTTSSNSTGTTTTSTTTNPSQSSLTYSLQSVVGSGQAVTAGQTATFTITLSSVSVPNSTVNLSCAVSAPQAKCGVSQSVLPLSGTPQQFTVNVTTASSLAIAPISGTGRSTSTDGGMMVALLLPIVVSAMTFCLGFQNRKYGSKVAPGCAIALLAVGLMMEIGCGSTSTPSSSSNTNTSANATSTPTGSYMVTVTAMTSTGGNTAQTIQIPFSVH
jgi:hypothetical protein